MEFPEKITEYSNEAFTMTVQWLFTGGYEKLATEKQPKRVNVDKWYST